MSKKAIVASVLGLALVAGSANIMAHEAGDWLLRVGGLNVDPKSNNSPIVDVDSDSSLTFTVSYLYSSNWAVELLAAWPFEHGINLKGTADRVAKTKHLPPTLSLQYHFLPGADFQPYIGLGVNYTNFFDEETSGALAGTNLSLDDSWGVAGQIGIDWMLSDKWFLNLEARYIDIETDATLDGASIGKVEIDPTLYGAHIGFKF